MQFHSCNWSFFTKISTNCYSFFRPPFHLNIVGIQDCTPCYWLATIGWLQLYTCVFLFPFCCFAVSLCFALVHTFLIFIFIFQWFFVLFSYTFFLLWNIQRIDVKFIWNNSYLNCGCRWKWRMIIAVNFPVWAIANKKPEKKSGLIRDSNPWPPRYRCDALPNWKINCDDHSSLSSTSAVQIWIISYILHNQMLLISAPSRHGICSSSFHESCG